MDGVWYRLDQKEIKKKKKERKENPHVRLRGCLRVQRASFYWSSDGIEQPNPTQLAFFACFCLLSKNLTLTTTASLRVSFSFIIFRVVVEDKLYINDQVPLSLCYSHVVVLSRLFNFFFFFL